MEEGVHVVRLVLVEDLHVDGLALGSTVGVKDLIGRVVVLGLGRVKTVQRARSDEDLVVGHDLNRRVPTSCVELCARLIPLLTIKRCVRCRALEETDALETITNSGVNEVERGVTTEGNESSISKENSAGAEGVRLVSKRSQLLRVGVVLRRVGVLSVGKLELGVVLDLVQENNLTVGHQTSVHGWDTGATLDDKGSRLSSSGSRAGLGCRDRGCVEARTRLAAFAAVGSAITAVSVHGAAGSLSPVTADSVSERSTAAAIGGLNASGYYRGNLNARWLTKNRLARGGGGRRTGSSSGSDGVFGGGSILATVLAAISNEAMTFSRTAVSVRTAASAVRAIGIACGTTEVLTTATVIPGRDCSSLCRYRCDRSVVAAGKTSGSAVNLAGSAPSVLRATGTTVDCAVGVAKQVAMSRTTLAILGVLCLPLLRDKLEVGGREFGMVALDVSDALVAVTAVLSSQAAVRRVDIASRVDPVEVDVGRGEPSASAEGKNRDPHC